MYIQLEDTFSVIFAIQLARNDLSSLALLKQPSQISFKVHITYSGSIGFTINTSIVIVIVINFVFIISIEDCNIDWKITIHISMYLKLVGFLEILIYFLYIQFLSQKWNYLSVRDKNYADNCMFVLCFHHKTLLSLRSKESRNYRSLQPTFALWPAILNVGVTECYYTVE